MFATQPAPGLRVLKRDASTSAIAPVGETFTAANMVEAAVSDEIAALGDHHRPGLAATALALARIMDNPRAVSTQPAAAKILAALLDKLRSASARGRRGGLAVVRAMSSRDPGT